LTCAWPPGATHAGESMSRAGVGALARICAHLRRRGDVRPRPAPSARRRRPSADVRHASRLLPGRLPLLLRLRRHPHRRAGASCLQRRLPVRTEEGARNLRRYGVDWRALLRSPCTLELAVGSPQCWLAACGVRMRARRAACLAALLVCCLSAAAPRPAACRALSQPLTALHVRRLVATPAARDAAAAVHNRRMLSLRMPAC
jgi:hypothetical protein